MATIRRHPTRPGNWQVRYYDPGGRQRTRNFGKKSDADKYAKLVEADKLRGQWADPNLGTIRFGEWAEQVMASRSNLAPSALARDDSYMRRQVLPHLGDFRLSSVSPVDVQTWLGKLTAAGYAPATVRKAHELGAGVFEAAVLSDLIVKTPCRGIRLPKVEKTEMRFLSVDEIRHLSEAIDPRYRVLILTAAGTGYVGANLPG